MRVWEGRYKGYDEDQKLGERESWRKEVNQK